jgi:hypothetical protein
MTGLNDFAPYRKQFLSFVVRNICSDRRKVICIFQYPILWNTTRDLLAIPGVSESDIRASLLKGELNHKLKAKDIIVEYSDIDLLQFNDDQKAFLEAAGITKGLEVTSGGALLYLWKEEISLIGTKDGSNKTFYTPDKFINGLFITGDTFHIHVKHNGRDLYENIDYTISESSGAGSGYDTINLISLTPIVNSQLFATYAIKRS